MLENDRLKRNILAMILALVMVMSVLALVPIISAETGENDGLDDGTDDTGDSGSSTGEPGDDSIGDDLNDSDGDGEDDETEDATDRDVLVDAEPEGVEIESVLSNGESRDRIQFQFEKEDGVEIHLRYQQHADDVQSEIDSEVKFKALVEFRDTDGNGLYDPGTDELLSEVDLTSHAFNDVAYDQVATLDGETAHVVSIQTTDGLFAVTAHVVGSFASTESGKVSPSETKLDVSITNYPFTAQDSQLALRVKVEYDVEANVDEDDETHDEQEGHAENEREVEIASNGFTAFFSWVEQAEVDGVVSPVKATPLDLNVEGEGSLYLVYPQGNAIVHDPKVGVVRGVSASGPANADDMTPMVTFLASIAVAAIVVGALVRMRLARNGKV